MTSDYFVKGQGAGMIGNCLNFFCKAENRVRRLVCQTLSKVLDIWSATAQVASDLLKALAFLSDTTWRSAVDQEGLRPYWKSDKKPYFSRWLTILLFTSFTNHRKKTNRVVSF